jgi:hypothetical protein
MAQTIKCHATLQGAYCVEMLEKVLTLVTKIITIGDCSKAETRTFFEERVLPRVPERLRSALEFERLYEAFGGRLVHIQDYVTDYGENFRIV